MNVGFATLLIVPTDGPSVCCQLYDTMVFVVTTPFNVLLPGVEPVPSSVTVEPALHFLVLEVDMRSAEDLGLRQP